MKRCADGCRFLNKRKNQNWCDFYNTVIKNKGRFCNNFKPETIWSKFIKWLGI